MKAIIEGLLFLVGDEGLTIEDISNIIEKPVDEVDGALRELINDYESDTRGIQIEYLGNHYKLTTKPIHKEYYKKLAITEENSELSQAALETLAIIAYNAPITRVDIDNIRGVNSTFVLRKLLLKGLIEDVGNSDAPGRPKLYNVTQDFLDYFGLGSINELPTIETPEEITDDDKNLFESKYTEETQ